MKFSLTVVQNKTSHKILGGGNVFHLTLGPLDIFL